MPVTYGWPLYYQQSYIDFWFDGDTLETTPSVLVHEPVMNEYYNQFMNHQVTIGEARRAIFLEIKSFK